MNFSELTAGIKRQPVKQTRSDDEDYLEVVVEVTSLDKFRPVLESFLGASLKPAGVSPDPKKVPPLIDTLGGVQSNQTLYYRKEAGVESYAMIWPWGNGQLATLRIGQVKSQV